jgi:hypothetical protein
MPLFPDDFAIHATHEKNDVEAVGEANKNRRELLQFRLVSVKDHKI